MNYRDQIKPVADKFLVMLTLPLTLLSVIAISMLYLVFGQADIFFFQQRMGVGTVPFTMIKFRTLNNDRTLPIEKRKFFIGTILRATSLDELPQLYHVLRGQMSLVGPRPLPIEYKDYMRSEQLVRHSVRPGITGLAQVNGRHAISWRKKFEYDLLYVRGISFWLDLRILFKTIFVLLSFKKDISLDEQPFKGN